MLREDPSWERIYRSTIVNHEAARRWASREVHPIQRLRAIDTTDLVKLHAKTSGLRRVTYSDLAEISWPGGGAPLADLRLFEKFYDSDDAQDPPSWEVEVPISVEDADQSGTWTEGDVFYFYAQNLYDRLPEAPKYLTRYGRRHVYWVGLRSVTPNDRMGTTSSWLDQEPDTVAAYPWIEHLEKEVSAYSKVGAGAPTRPIDNETNIRDGVASVRSKHSYWQGGDPWDWVSSSGQWNSVTFDLPGYLAPNWLAARFQGIRRPAQNLTSHHIHMYLARPTDRDTTRLSGTPVIVRHQDSTLYVATAEDLQGMPLEERNNIFVHLESPLGYGAGLHYLEIAYDRQPRFLNGLCQIATGDRVGPSEYRLANPSFDDATIFGIEFTDPQQPKALEIDQDRQWTGSGTAVRPFLRFDLDGNERRFWVGAASLIPPPEEMVLDVPSDLAAPGEHDYVVVIPREWIPTIQPLVAHRESEQGGGHRVLVAAIDDVFDEFPGGRHCRHTSRHRSPATRGESSFRRISGSLITWTQRGRLSVFCPTCMWGVFLWAMLGS
jgi:hypothetical protein